MSAVAMAMELVKNKAKKIQICSIICPLQIDIKSLRSTLF